MAKIIIHIPTVQFGYIEAQYESIEEYKEQHPKLKEAMKEVKEKINQLIKE
jgi:hypothetical protein